MSSAKSNSIVGKSNSGIVGKSNSGTRLNFKESTIVSRVGLLSGMLEDSSRPRKILQDHLILLL
jgi:hypothetical protein